MSDTRHTPGPWETSRLDWRGEPSQHRVYISGDRRPVGKTGTSITAVAVVEGNATSLCVTAANARLIAAAPELLAACERVLLVLQVAAVSDQAYQPAAVALAAVVAKAKGEPCGPS